MDAELVRRTMRETPANENGCKLWTTNLQPDGYARISYEGELVMVHRLAYVLQHGESPPMVDHTCFVHNCFAVEHLRGVTRKQNGEHRQGANRQSGTGVRGVSFRYGKYQAHVRHHGRLHHVGTFADLKSAREAVTEERKRLFTHDNDNRRENT